MQCKIAISLLVSVLVAGSALSQPNVLVNGDFEINPPPTGNFGNHVGYSIAPWVLLTGAQSNVVKVDGPGVYNYGNNGPASDATAPGAGIEQHYLDIAAGSNTFYQVFTPRCSGQVSFGGSFSTRANNPATGHVEIRIGNQGPPGALVGTTNTVNLPAGNSQTWTNVTYTAFVNAGQTYSFVVFMDNNMNFDNGFVRFASDCPEPDPCCPPWDSYALQEQLVYQGTGGISAPYTLAFQPLPFFSNQMQAYIDYLNTLNPNITQITIQFRLHDGGTGSTPVAAAQLGVSHYITWQAGLAAPFPAPTFFSGAAETMVVNHWYVIHTGIYLENRQTFFPSSCADNDLSVRLQVQPLATAAPKTVTLAPSATLLFRDRTGKTRERQIVMRR